MAPVVERVRYNLGVPNYTLGDRQTGPQSVPSSLGPRCYAKNGVEMTPSRGMWYSIEPHPKPVPSSKAALGG